MNPRDDVLFDYCPVCGKDLRVRPNGTFRVHGPRNNPCPGSGAVSPIWGVE